MKSIQVRVPKKLLERIDEKVKRGEYGSRSDAVRTMLRYFEFMEKRREQIKMLKETFKRMDKGERIPLEEL